MKRLWGTAVVISKKRQAGLNYFATLMVALVFIGLGGAARADVTYSLTPYSGLIPAAVNNHGVVVGSSSLNYNQTPIHWSASTGKVAITMGAGHIGLATDINDNGLVCGWKQWIAGSAGVPDAWLYDKNSSGFVPVNDPAMSQAYAVTNSIAPTVGGTYTYTNYSGTQRYYRASVYKSTGGTAYTVTRIGGAYRVEAMNLDGYAVGRVGSSEADAFVQTPAGSFYTLPGLASGTAEAARDINDSGYIAGYATNAANQDRAVVWLGNTTPTDLGVLANRSTTPGGQESQANEINRWGDVVGWSHIWLEGQPRRQHAFIYRDGVMKDINDLTAAGTPTITTAYAINDVGQIATEQGLLTPSYVADSEFNAMGAWSKTTATGQADIVTDPDDIANQVLRLTTGSPVAVSQTVDTPDQPFFLEFDYRFDDLAGVISVTLDGTEILPQISAADTAWHHFESLISDPSLFGLDDVELKITLDSGTASVAFLDEVAMTPTAVPEPLTLNLLIISGLTFLKRRRK